MSLVCPAAGHCSLEVPLQRAALPRLAALSVAGVTFRFYAASSPRSPTVSVTLITAAMCGVDSPLATTREPAKLQEGP
jgi:hypothetical protein